METREDPIAKEKLYKCVECKRWEQDTANGLCQVCWEHRDDNEKEPKTKPSDTYGLC